MAILRKDTSLICPCLQLMRSAELKCTQMQSEKFGDSTWLVSDLPQHSQQDLLVLFEEALEPRITAARKKRQRECAAAFFAWHLDGRLMLHLGKVLER